MSDTTQGAMDEGTMGPVSSNSPGSNFDYAYDYNYDYRDMTTGESAGEVDTEGSDDGPMG